LLGTLAFLHNQTILLEEIKNFEFKLVFKVILEGKNRSNIGSTLFFVSSCEKRLIVVDIFKFVKKDLHEEKTLAELIRINKRIGR